MENRTAVQEIYNHLGDELSKEIFGYRVMYTETGGGLAGGDTLWLYKIIGTIPNLPQNFWNKGIKRVIFGAGSFGKDLVRFLPGKFECMVDNYQCGTEYKGVPVVSLKECLSSYPDADIYVASSLYHNDIVHQLKEASVSENRIYDLSGEYYDLESRQYFDLPYLVHDQDEIFVDCGCLNGQTSRNFIRWSNNQYKHIYAFEPEIDKIAECKKMLPEDKVSIYNLATWKEKTELRFSDGGGGSSCICEEGKAVVNADSLDNVLRDEKVSFIKMDIEGAELEALKGSEYLIQKNHPKLAISIYHRPDDIYKIPLLLLQYNPGYTFYLRHYSYNPGETVLYAVDKRKIEE